MSRRRQKSPVGHKSLRQRARASRDAALEGVRRGADPSWLADFLKAIRKTAMLMREFISDDVWRVGGVFPTRENRAAGPVFQHAARLGWVTRTNKMRSSVRSNLSGKPVWRSHIFKGS